MMQDLAAHILDIAYNSIRANATKIDIVYAVDKSTNKLEIIIKDNGDGIEQNQLQNLTNPFYSTRKTRKIGLGLAFLNDLAKFCDGYLDIKSDINKGTNVKLVVEYNHLDLPPLGDIGEAIMLLIQANREIDYHFIYKVDSQIFVFDTMEIKETLEDIKIDDYEILKWIKNYINENINYKGG